MTCREKLGREHPDWSEDKILEVIHFECPWAYDYATKPDFCDGGETPAKCGLCWDREIEEIDMREIVKEDISINDKDDVLMCSSMTKLADDACRIREKLITGGFSESEAFSLILTMFDKWLR